MNRLVSYQGWRLAGFTLVELLTVVTLIGILVSLLFPAIQAGRESARQSICQNNLKQVGLALHGHANSQGRFPIGAKGGTFGSIGISWWVSILPYLDEENIFSKYEGESAHSGYVLMQPRNGKLVNGVVIDTMICPSSNLPPLRAVGTFQLMMPSYVGISGSCSHDDFPEVRVNRCCGPLGDGEISAGGILFPNDSIGIGDITDGMSNTLAVGEASDFAYHDDGTPFRIDGGHTLGWVAGTSVPTTPPDYLAPYPAWNITTIRYTPNERRYLLPGVNQDHGANNPLVSSHPGGVYGLFVDGSVQYVCEEIDNLTLKQIATRDDGSISHAP